MTMASSSRMRACRLKGGAMRISGQGRKAPPCQRCNERFTPMRTLGSTGTRIGTISTGSGVAISVSIADRREGEPSSAKAKSASATPGNEAA